LENPLVLPLKEPSQKVGIWMRELADGKEEQHKGDFCGMKIVLPL
jgi:hypothetical protein